MRNVSANASYYPGKTALGTTGHAASTQLDEDRVEKGACGEWGGGGATNSKQ